MVATGRLRWPVRRGLRSVREAGPAVVSAGAADGPLRGLRSVVNDSPTIGLGPRVLLVDDDQELGGQVARTLAGAGFQVTWIQDGDRAQAVDPQRFQLVVLDLMLPGARGLDVLKEYRRRSDVPVLVLSAMRESAGIVRALQLGADDYVTKPCWPEQLVARVQARLRRPHLAKERGWQIGELFLDAQARALRLGDGEILELTHNEFRLLAALARRPGELLSRSRLFRAVFETEDFGETRRLDALVSRLRRKLGRHAERLETLRGSGYRLAESTS